MNDPDQRLKFCEKIMSALIRIYFFSLTVWITVISSDIDSKDIPNLPKKHTANNTKNKINTRGLRFRLAVLIFCS